VRIYARIKPLSEWCSPVRIDNPQNRACVGKIVVVDSEDFIVIDHPDCQQIAYRKLVDSNGAEIAASFRYNCIHVIEALD